MNWPIGCGVDFKGVFDRDRREILAFNEFHNGQNKLATIECDITDTARLDELLGPYQRQALAMNLTWRRCGTANSARCSSARR